MSPSEPPFTDPPLPCLDCAARISCLIGQMPRPQQDRLGPLIREQRFRKGEVLQAEGAEVEMVRTIKLGTVMLTRSGPDHVPRPVALVGRGHLMGLMGLLGQTTQVGAQALSPGRICDVPVAAMLGALVKDPVLQDTLHEQICRTVARLADWGQTMRLRGLHRQLVASLMLLAHEQGTRMVRIPSHVALSELLRTTRESVARTLRQLEDQGHLQRNDRWHVTLAPGHERLFAEG